MKEHRVEGETLILTLRGGGEVWCDRSLVSRIEPDEVPYPEPEIAQAPAPELAEPSRYDAVIERISAEHGVDSRLVRAVIQVESGYQSRARSRKGAMGLMQLMPQTAHQYSVADPYDPRANIEGGIRHLSSLLQRFELPAALAAYNAGEAAVQRFGGIPPFRETRDYVRRVLRLVSR